MAPMLLCYLLWILALLGWGRGTARLLRAEGAIDSADEPARFAVAGMLGLAAAIAIGFALNFFIGLGPIVSALFLACGLALFTLHARALLAGLSPADGAFFVLFLTVVAYAAGGTVFHYDTGLYHLQAVSWMTSGPLPAGLANLHARFGMNSAWWAAAAMLELPGAGGHAVQILNPLLAFFMGTGVYAALKRGARGEAPVSAIFLALAAFPLAYRGVGSIEINSLSTDFPSGCFTLIVCYLTLRSGEIRGGDGLLWAALALAAAGAMIKLSLAAPAMALWAMAAIETARRSRVPRPPAVTFRLFAIISAIAALWAARGVLISGAPLFPSRLLYFPGLSWAVPADRIDAYAELVRNWARSPGWTTGMEWTPWAWLGPWARGLVTEETAALALMAAAGWTLLAMRAGGTRAAIAKSGIWPAVIPPLAGLGVWLITAPDFRFGWPFVYAAALLLFSAGAAGWKSVWVAPARRRVLVAGYLFALAAGLGVKLAGLHRSPEGWAWNIQRPPVFSWPALPAAQLESISIDGAAINIPREGDQCWAAPLPCAPAADPKLRMKTHASGRPVKFWIEK